MLSMERLVASGAGMVIALAAAAQIAVPPCCKYLWEWPPEDNPDGACVGSVGLSCQTGAMNVWGEDPMARKKGLWVEAKCFLVTHGENAHFLRQDCADPPPAGSHFIGVLPNGQCCYAFGYEPHITIDPFGTGYWTRNCEGECDEYQY